MRSILTALVGLVLVCGVAACGGGGGNEPEEPTAPGVLRTLALQGESAPETAGDFAAFDTDPPMDVAFGGWTVFVANTTDGDAARCVYVAQPNGDLLLAFRTGETVPDAGGGTIAGFDAVWILPDGRFLVAVAITGDGDGRTQGLLSARVSGGAVTDKQDVLYDQRAMSDIGLTGTLSNIRYELLVFLEDGRVFVPIVTDLSEEALLRMESDGSGLVPLIKDGDAVPSGGRTFVALHALGVAPSGERYAFVAERDDARNALYTGTSVPETAVITDPQAYGLLFVEGDDLSEGVADEIPGPQPLLVDNAGRVLFKAVSSENADHLCVVAFGFPPNFLAVEGGIDVWTDGAFQELDWIHNQRGGTAPFFMAGLGTNSRGISFGIFLATDLQGSTALAMWDTRDAPSGLGANVRFTSTFPGLAGQGRRDGDATGSLAFANVLNNGRPGAFWLIPSSGLFTIAASGQDIPGGGGSFAASNNWRTTIAQDVMLFRAPVDGLRSGIFRRGP